MQYIVTACQPAGKGRVEVALDERLHFQLYAGEVRKLSLEAGTELSEEQYQHILHEIIGKRAIKRAMYLLQRQERTEHQLREKLLQSYPAEAVEDAVAYVKRYRYLDDERYARTFIRYHQDNRSRMRLKTDLLRRGVPGDLVSSCLEEEFQSDEPEQIRKLLAKKKFAADSADEAQRRKMYQFLMRRGFQYSDIRKAMESAGGS